MKRIGLALIAVAALSGAGCTSIFHRPHFVQIRPVTTLTADAEPREAARSAYYQSAVRAISARDYGLALDLLQSARAQTPSDPAVINAFGVVYDKLGRFDLSARYYTQAAALDPDSPIVRQNLAYSAQLQGKWAPDAPTTALAAATPTATPTAIASTPVSAQAVAGPPVASTPTLLGAPKPVTLALASAPPQQPKSVITIASAAAPGVTIAIAPNGAILTGSALQIVDASGATNGAEGVRQQLVSRGWSAPKVASLAQAETRTRIVFPQGGLAIAQALARTLPFPVELAACDNRCTSLSLIVGQDAAQHLRAHS